MCLQVCACYCVCYEFTYLEFVGLDQVVWDDIFADGGVDISVLEDVVNQEVCMCVYVCMCVRESLCMFVCVCLCLSVHGVCLCGVP